MKFFVDDKFSIVVHEFDERGWDRHFDQASSQFIWTNLRNVAWDNVTDDEQVVNHLRGSQHLSNKSFLAYHLEAVGDRSHMPVQWSSAYQDMRHLTETVLVHTLYANALILKELTENEDNKSKSLASSDLAVLEDCRSIFRILSSDDDWSTTPCAETCSSLLGVLTGGATAAPSPAFAMSMSEASKAQNCSDAYGTSTTWIVKPVGAGRGENITLVRGPAAVIRAVVEMNYKCVVQKYIERPLLVRGRRKFDIRQWVLVTSVQPLRVYGFSEFYCRLTGKPFQLSEESLGDAIVHLCNHAVQSQAPTARADSSAERTGEGEGYLLSQEGLEQELIAAGLACGINPDGTPASIIQTALLPQIRRISVAAVRATRDNLDRVGRGFEWLGLDLIVTEGLEVKMLECNVSPDISGSTPLTARLVRQGVRELLSLILPASAPSTKSSATSGADSQQLPSWQLWYDSSTISSQKKGANIPTRAPPAASELSVLQFAHMKREMAILRKDHTPLKQELALQILATLSANGNENGGQDESDDQDEF
eukprot:GSChrysophyteH1.ASY1.ANO1.1792.1 assembled CDS